MTGSPRIDSIAPATGELLGSVPAVEPNAVADLIETARGAQRAWEAAGPVGRANVVSALGRLLTERADDVAELLAAEVGKPIGEARAEVARAVQICGYLGGIGYELGGIVRRSGDPAVTILARQVPVGVAGAITPWNFPIAIAAWKIIPALVSGCSVVWKPASASVLTAQQFARIASDAGVPHGVLTCVYGGAEIGRALSEGPIDALSFTGSTAVGRSLRRKLGGRVRPRLTLELGGVNISHVLADADIPRSARDIVAAAYGYAGQKCTATQVIAADQAVADDLVEAVREELVALRVGDPLEKGTVVGPVIDSRTAEGLRSAIERLGTQAELVGQAATPGGGAYVAPTLFRDRDGTSDLVRNEYFGPVACIVVTRSPADHDRVARTSGMGLTAAIYGTDFDRIRAMLNHVGTGVVAVNRPSTGLDPHVPFGGWDESGGHFSEQGTEGLRFYVRWQTVYWRGDGPDVYFP